jgi:hypothetical protein
MMKKKRVLESDAWGVVCSEGALARKLPYENAFAIAAHESKRTGHQHTVVTTEAASKKPLIRPMKSKKAGEE